MALAEAIPTTRVPADGPYHEIYPEGVKVSEFISSRAIEPFYDVLEILASVVKDNELKAIITVCELDQDLGQPLGPKGLYGCTGSIGFTGGVTGITGPSYSEPVIRGPPPVQDRRRYGLEEIMINIKWKKETDIKLEGKTLPVVTPLIKTLSYVKGVDGTLKCKKETVMNRTKFTYLAVAKPLFAEVVKTYQTIHPDWTEEDMFQSKWKEALSVKRSHDSYYDYDPTDAAILNALDPYLFDIVTLVDITDVSAASASAGKVFKQASEFKNVTTDQVTYQYNVSLLAVDLKANKETLLDWLKA